MLISNQPPHIITALWVFIVMLAILCFSVFLWRSLCTAILAIPQRANF